MQTLSRRPSSPLGILRLNSLCSLVLLLLFAAPAAGQTPAPAAGQPPVAAPPAGQTPVAAPDTSTLVDRVVAVVGDSIILLTELQQEFAIASADNPTATQEAVLDEIINLMLVVQAAAQDSTIIPSDAEISQRVETVFQENQARYGSQAEFQAALAEGGMTTASYRTQLRARILAQYIQNTYMQRALQTAPVMAVSDEEVRAYFDAHKAEVAPLPERLVVQQVAVKVTPSEAEWERARQKADSLLQLIRQGANFDTLAMQHSQDPGSAVRGGDLSDPTTGAWTRKGGTVFEFDRALFLLPDGGVSEPVRTIYGYHIIKSERSRPGEKKARHILIRPEVGQADVDRAKAAADDVARRIGAGESPITLGQTIGEKELSREITIPRGADAGVPADYQRALASVQEGQVITFQTDQLNQQADAFFVVVKIARILPAGPITLEDAKEQIGQIILNEKRQQRIYADLREKTYVEIRP
jgi:peptidyl-prolyl cis-trans isomerase SurA